MNNDQRNDLEESKDVDVNLTMPQQRDSSNQEGQQQEASAAQPEPASDNEFEEDGTHKTREGQEEGEEDNDQNYHFYKEYCRLYYANIILTNRLQQLLNEKQDLGYKLNRLEVSILYFPYIF